VIAYLDTNVVVRLSQGNLPGIRSQTRKILEQAVLLISPVVLIELEFLYEITRIKLSGRDILKKLDHEIRLRVCDLPFPSVANTALDEKWTRDPFDRIIVAQAKANGFAFLISADEEIAQHYPRTIW